VSATAKCGEYGFPIAQPRFSGDYGYAGDLPDMSISGNVTRVGAATFCPVSILDRDQTTADIFVYGVPIRHFRTPTHL
jgi:hypothetical protein